MDRGWRTAMGFALVFAVVGVIVYLGIAGRTGWWPQTADCAVIDSRVVSYVTGSSRHPLILWRGEYRIQYAVNGRQYFTWADAGWTDSDKNFVAGKVNDLTIDCPVRLQYNPENPGESVTHLKRR